MASPFQRYTQGIEPIKGISEAGANIGQLQFAGLAQAGKAIGEGLEKYGQNLKQEEDIRSAGAGILGQTISKYLIDDVDEKTGQPSGEKYIDPKAPQFVHDAYKKALKQNEGDWRIGLKGMATSEIKEAVATHQEWKAQTQQETENNFKSAAIQLQQRAADLDAERVKIAKDAAYWQNKKAQEEDDITQAKREILSTAVDPTYRHTFNRDETRTKGTLVNPATGETQEDVDLADAAASLGIKPEDIVSEEVYRKLQEAATGKPEQVVGKVFAKDAKFDSLAPFTQQSGVRSKDEDGVERTDAGRFIEGMYKASLRSGVDPEKAKRAFFANKETGGFNASININSETYALAQKLAGKESIQAALKSQGIPLTPPVAKDLKKFVLKNESTYDLTKKISVDIDLKQNEIFDEKYNRVAESLAQRGKSIPFSRDQLDTLLGINSIPHLTLPNGQKVYTIGKKTYFENQLNALSEGQSVDDEIPDDMTIGHAKLITFNQWIKQFNKLTDIGGGFKIQFKGDWRSFRGDIEKDKPEIEDAIKDLSKINRVADGMIKLTGDSFAKKLLSPAWDSEYTTLQLTAQTMRKYFISKGQETDKDNDRLSRIVAEQGVWLKANPELAKKIIENFRLIVNEQTKSTLERAGFSIDGGEKVDRTALSKLLDEAESKFSPKK